MARSTVRWDRSKGRPEPIRALNRVAEHENGEPLVDLRRAAPSVRFIRATTIPFARESVAAMAERAAQSLPSGVGLAVTDAWRPFRRQKLIYEWMRDCYLAAFPDASYAQMRRVVCRWVAPIDQKAPPGHCTGAALDVMLVDPTGEPLDHSSPYDRLHGGPTFALGLTPEAERNRMRLYEAMTGAGFSNCRDEWWHYSWGDAGWAVRTGEASCVYGLVELPTDVYSEAQAIWEAQIAERANPFLAP